MMFTPTESSNLISDGFCKTMKTSYTKQKGNNYNNNYNRRSRVVENDIILKRDYSCHIEPIYDCCPLRLNQISTSCNTSTMKLDRPVVGGNNVTTTQGRQSFHGHNDNSSRNLVTSHELKTTVKMYRQRPKRLVLTSSLLSSYHHLQLIQMIAIIVVTCLVGPLDCFSDTQLTPTIPSLCPLVSSCLCKWSNGKISTTCERRNLQSIPMQLPSDTQILDMTGNNLNHLPQHIFQDRRITNLQRLFLSECKISFISDEAFAQLTNLVELDLSNNNIQQVPSKALELTKYSLRKLNLAHNLIHVLDTGAFSRLSHLNVLDLSNNQLSQMKPNPFQGLNDLKELKLNENRLSQLPSNVISDLHEYLIIDLYGNPWHCDCELKQSIDLMNRRHIQQSINPTCASPQRHKDIRWQNVKSDEFMCPPVIINKQNELVVGAGSNVTLECTARGSAPLTFVWFQDERNLTRSGGGNQSEPPPSTKLLEEKRYEIAEEQGQFNTTTSILYLMNLKLTDTSLFLCWVENSAGYTLGNFSLIVNDSPPFNVASGDSTSSGTISGFGNSILHLFGLDSKDSTGAQIAIVMAAFLLLLIVAITCLLVFKQMMGGYSSKSSTNSDLKVHQVDGKLSASNKFGGGAVGTVKAGQSMFASSDSVGTSEDDDDQVSSGSQSSCRKSNPKVLAVNDLGGFIEHMRSGIINMDYHNLSPVIQFNDTMKRSNQHHHQQPQHQQETQQLPLLNHFQTSSNASSQQPLYGIGQTSNGSNSMATTLSDLSPSSGSASTSFANSNNHVMYASHPQQHLMGSMNAADMGSNSLSRGPPPTTNCDFQGHPHQQMRNSQQQQQPLHQQEMSSAPSYTSDCQSGYSEDPLLGPGHHHSAQMMPPSYNYDMSILAPQHQQQQQIYNPMTLVGNPMPMQHHHHGHMSQNSSRPSSMNGHLLPNDPRNLMGTIQGSPGSFQVL